MDFLDFLVMETLRSFFWTPLFMVLPRWPLDPIDVILVSLVLIPDMGVDSSIGLVNPATMACEFSLGVFQKLGLSS